MSFAAAQPVQLMPNRGTQSPAPRCLFFPLWLKQNRIRRIHSLPSAARLNLYFISGAIRYKVISPLYGFFPFFSGKSSLGAFFIVFVGKIAYNKN